MSGVVIGCWFAGVVLAIAVVILNQSEPLPAFLIGCTGGFVGVCVGLAVDA